MSRPPKPVAQVKKVAPPAVPEAGFRHSGSSFGSAGYSSAGEDHVFHEQGRGKIILNIRCNRSLICKLILSCSV